MPTELRERMALGVGSSAGGRLPLTWLTPRSLGLNNGAQRNVFFEAALARGAQLNCPEGTSRAVVESITQSGDLPSWSTARICEQPEGKTLKVNIVSAVPHIVPDDSGETFCRANEWWVAVLSS